MQARAAPAREPTWIANVGLLPSLAASDAQRGEAMGRIQRAAHKDALELIQNHCKECGG